MYEPWITDPSEDALMKLIEERERLEGAASSSPSYNHDYHTKDSGQWDILSKQDLGEPAQHTSLYSPHTHINASEPELLESAHRQGSSLLPTAIMGYHISGSPTSQLRSRRSISGSPYRSAAKRRSSSSRRERSPSRRRHESPSRRKVLYEHLRSRSKSKGRLRKRSRSMSIPRFKRGRSLLKNRRGFIPRPRIFNAFQRMQRSPLRSRPGVRKRSISRSRDRRLRSISKDKRRSCSKDRKRLRSNSRDKKRSSSRSRYPKQKHSRSKNGRQSNSKDRTRNTSSDKKCHRSNSRDKKRSGSRSIDRKQKRSRSRDHKRSSSKDRTRNSSSDKNRHSHSHSRSSSTDKKPKPSRWSTNRDDKRSSSKDRTSDPHPETAAAIQAPVVPKQSPIVAAAVTAATNNILEFVSIMNEINDKAKTKPQSKTVPISNKVPEVPRIDILPEFDPFDKGNAIVTWLTRVDDVAKLLGWKEKEILQHAMPKLKGGARAWYQGRKAFVHTWAEWKKKLIEQFPCPDFVQMFDELKARQSDSKESLEKYYNDKMILVKRCGFTGRQAVQCVVQGIKDEQVRSIAAAGHYEEPELLLLYLRTAEPQRTKVPVPKKIPPLMANFKPAHQINGLPPFFRQ